MSDPTEQLVYSHKNNRQIALYAMPRFGINIFIGIIDFALFFLYEDVYNLDPLLVGVGSMLGKLSIALSNFFLGWISDHTKSPLGRRKPYLYLMTPLLAVFYLLLLLPGLILGANPTENKLFLWFVTFNCLSQAFYAITIIYHSWTAEQFPSSQRPRVSAFQNGFNFLGTTVVVLFSMLVLTDVKDEIQLNPAQIPREYLVSVIIFALILVGLVYVTTTVMPVEQTPRYTTKLLDDLRVIIRNKNLILVCILQGICSFAWAMISALLLGYTENVLKLEGSTYIIIAGAMISTMIASLFVWEKYIRRQGKEKALARVFIIGIIVTPFSLLGYFHFSASIAFALPFIIALAIAMGGWYLFPYIIYADIAEKDMKETGELKAGIYMGFPSIILNIFQAFSLLLTGWITGINRSVANVPDSEPFSIGFLLWGPIASLILIISFFYAKKFVKLDFNNRNQENSK